MKQKHKFVLELAKHLASCGVFYFFFERYGQRVNPTMPIASPNVEEADEAKSKKKEASTTWMTIRKGRVAPRNNRVTPIAIRSPGYFVIVYITNRQRNAQALAQNRAALAGRTSP